MTEPAAPLTPFPLSALLDRIAREWSSRNRIFDMPTARFFDVSNGPDLSVDFMGRAAATPIGPAAGPHSQLAQNIVLSWLGGARIFELKTVQILDELDIPRPCIDMNNVGYNVEWSQELRLEQSLEEYVKGSMLIEILVASGEPLRHTQDDVVFSGWAIECRVSAEDPYNGFLPSPGVIEMLYEPGGPGVRVDTGVSKGFEVPIFYDPLIAKLITWGRDRDQAIRRMHRALRDYKILGIHNNIPFLMAIIRHRKFLQGAIHTEFLDENTDLFEQEPKLNAEYAAVVAALLDFTSKGTAAGNGDAPVPSDVAGAWKRAGRTRSWDKPWG